VRIGSSLINVIGAGFCGNSVCCSCPEADWPACFDVMWVANIDVATSNNMVSIVQNEIVGKDFFGEGGG
jgi:hypothetical protein